LKLIILDIFQSDSEEEEEEEKEKEAEKNDLFE
jgi:hypothetical protein